MSDRLVTIATFEAAPRAHVARAVLEDSGIQVFVADEEIVSMDWMLSNAVGGVKLKVRESDAERALAVLDARLGTDEPLVSDEELAAEAEAEPREDGESDPPPALAPSPAPLEPTEPLSPREECAGRLFFVAWLTFIFFVLSPYGLYVFGKAAFGPGPLRGRHRYTVFVGGMILLFPTFLFLCFLWAILIEFGY